MPKSKISASLENYLEVILELSNEKEFVRPIDIAKRLNISKASVSEAIRLLVQKQLISYKPYEPIILTPKGKRLAQSVSLKHEVLFSFLHEILGLEKNESMENACRIEHVISENLMERLIDFISYYKACDIHSFKEYYENLNK